MMQMTIRGKTIAGFATAKTYCQLVVLLSSKERKKNNILYKRKERDEITII